jgi:hypothetical protein
MFMPHQTKQINARRRVPLQIDLFAADRQKTVGEVPVWSGLPAEISAALTGLMTRLLLDHADKNGGGTTAETGHDH